MTTFCPEEFNLCQKCAATCDMTHKHSQSSCSDTHTHTCMHTHVHTGRWKTTRWIQGSEADAFISVLQKAISRVPEREQEKINAVGQECISFSPGSIDINRSVEKGWDRQRHKGGYFQSNLNKAESHCRCSSWIHFQKNTISFVYSSCKKKTKKERKNKKKGNRK